MFANEYLLAVPFFYGNWGVTAVYCIVYAGSVVVFPRVGAFRADYRASRVTSDEFLRAGEVAWVYSGGSVLLAVNRGGISRFVVVTRARHFRAVLAGVTGNERADPFSGSLSDHGRWVLVVGVV